jgi:hypothetical protein
MSQQTDLIDYAAPMMRIERLLKEMHNLLLDNKFEEAIEVGVLLATESRLLKHTLVLMKEKR